jgi:hypothetical protein
MFFLIAKLKRPENRTFKIIYLPAQPQDLAPCHRRLPGFTGPVPSAALDKPIQLSLTLYDKIPRLSTTDREF